MEHLEAQSYIVPFIEGKIPDDKQGDFYVHMKNCPACKEELQIYYTLIVGMRQLDNNESICRDFGKSLDGDLSRLGSKVSRRKSIKFSAFSFVVIGIVLIAGVLYARSLARVYRFEQATKLSNQGETYFQDSFQDKLKLTHEDRYLNSELLQVEDEITFFDRVKSYNQLMEDNERISEIGEGILNGEITTD